MTPAASLVLLSLAAARGCAAAKRSSTSAAAASASTWPRGVGPEFAKFYESDTHFACISNPLHKIPVSQVNDDYCDCPDGSDEPGTSACSHLSPLSPNVSSSVDASTDKLTLAFPGFYCQNRGHIPSYLPLISVNDGRCDHTLCCDGSDEWQHVGGTTCPDKCKEIGKEWRRKEEVRKKGLGIAMKRKKELVTEAARLRHLAEKRVEELQGQLKGAEDKAEETEREFTATEKTERSKVVRGGGGKAGGATVLVGLARARVEELRTNLETVWRQRDALDGRVKELEATLSTLKQEYNPNFNDEGVKRAVRAWEDYAAREKEGVWEAAQDGDLDEITKPDDENNGIDWAKWESGDDDSASSGGGGAAESILSALSAYAPPSLRSWLDAKMTSLQKLLVESGILADTSDSTGSTGSTPESAAVTAARKQRDAAKTSLTKIQTDLDNARSDLDKDYGSDDVFRALKDKCVAKDSGEYTYELCFLGATKQKPKKGGGDVNMGHFVGIGSEHVDADVDAEGRGLGVGERVLLTYANGQHCWNGPARSTVVVLACSADDEIWRVTESEKCVYRMEVGTAAVCLSDEDKAKKKGAEEGGGGGAGRKKDEL